MKSGKNQKMTTIIFNINSILIYSAFIILAISLLIQLYFYLVVYYKAAYSHNRSVKYHDNIPVSIIIAAKNEKLNLISKLEKVLTQDYPEFEVIVIDDSSDDGQKELLLEMAEKNSNLRTFRLSSSSGKKNALSKGIELAKYPYLLFIDADCYPESKHWISYMAAGFIEDKEIILGYGAYKKYNGILNAFIRYDTFIIALQYFGSALNGKAYMGVGRNLAYTKELWHRSNGFKAHENINSGDDDLFIISATNKNNTAIAAFTEAKTISEPKKTFLDFCKQKSRHFNSLKLYKPIHIFNASAELISRAMFYVSATILLFSGFGYLVLILFLLRLITQFIIIGRFSEKLNEKDLLPYMLIFDIFAFMVYPVLWIYKMLIISNK